MSGQNHQPTPDVLDQATAALRESLRNVPVPPGPSDELVASTVGAVAARDRVAVEGRRRRLFRYLRYAAAAVLALIALAGLLWPRGDRVVAFDRVLDNVQKARSVTFDETQEVGDQRPLHLKYFLEGSRARIEMKNGADILIVDTREKKGVLLVPPLKAAKVLDKDSQFHPNELAGRTPLDALLGLKDQKPVFLGTATIDGKTTQVVRVRGGKWGGSVGDWTIWIDPRTERPVKIQFVSTDSVPPVTKTLEHFVWNAKLDARLFDLGVPQGYTVGLPRERDARPKPPGGAGRLDRTREGEKP